MKDQVAAFWNTFSRRLEGARKMAGLPYRELEARIQKAVTYQTLSNWEKGMGKEIPKMEVIHALADALGVRYEFFFEPIRCAIGKPEFRRRKSRLKKSEEMAVLEQAQFALDRYLELESVLQYQEVVSNPLEGLVVDSPAAAEKAAAKIREAWQLGNNPIPKVVEMLEEKGIRVLSAGAPGSFDGMAAWAGEIPFMLVNQEIADRCRLRFTLLHELGHLFLKFPEGLPGNEMEALCNRFASAFLFPESAFRVHVGENRRHFTLEELVGLKEEWGMSIAAIMHRARDLNYLSAQAYMNFRIRYHQQGFLKSEPGFYPVSEQPGRFRQLVLRSFAEEVISGTKAAYLLNQPYEQFLEGCLLVA
jgi:Zn-dependent peptidase ImmA (M78 family)/DNA-binding XRE family transcriptional regulator